MTETEKEIRSFKAELRVDGNSSKRTLVGYAAVFDSTSVDLGGFIELIKPGAFRSSLTPTADLKCLMNHNSDKPLGRTPKTLTLREDDKGLYFELNIPNTTTGRDLTELVDTEVVTQCSFSFRTKGENWIDRGDDIPLRELTDVQLLEISVGVVFPAYESTYVSLRNCPEHIRQKCDKVFLAETDDLLERMYQMMDALELD